MTYLLLTTAFALSSVAAWYSIAGLMTIFAGAAVPIAVMGSVLEVAKLVVTSWLYRNWKDTPVLLKSYFVVAIIVLMLLTSMGIFGYLSKAHADQNMVSGDVLAKLSIIDERIKTEKENIDANRKIISQLDQQVDQTLSRSTSEAGANRSARLRRGQAEDRKAAQEEILSSQAKIARYNDERQPIAAEVRKVEAEVGPIKYIAALIYGDNLDSTFLEKAVRIVIILIVFVFDPLAILMFVAYNQSMKSKPEIEEAVPEVVHEPEPEPTIKEVKEPKKPNARGQVRKKKLKEKIEWERDRVLVPAKEQI